MKRICYLLAMAAICTPAFADLHIVQKKDKYGYADENGIVVIKEQFSTAMPFKNGRAKVQKGDKWGYIDTNGKEIIKIEYTEIGEFNDKGIARVNKSKKFGYIREDGSFVIKPEYNFIGSFNDQGYVWVAQGKTLESATKGLFKNDQMVIKPSYRCFGFYQKTDSCDYSDGSFFGADVANEMTENFSILSTSEIPYIWVDKSYKRGIVNLEGKEILKPQLYAMGAPVDGIVKIVQFNNKKNKYNYIDIYSGKKLLKKDIEKALDKKNPVHGCYPFRNGVAMVCPDDKTAYLIDKTGTQKSSSYTGMTAVADKGFIVIQNGRYGFMDLNANETIKPSTYSYLGAPKDFSDGLLVAKNADTGKCGYLSTNGDIMIAFNYDGAANFRYGKGYVKTTDGGWGVIDKSGNSLVETKWNNVMMSTHDNDDYIWVQKKDSKKWGCYNIQTKDFAFSDEYDSAEPFNLEGLSTVSRDGKYAIVKTTGSIVIPPLFDKSETCNKALSYIKEKGKDCMEEIDAYRFNIQFHPDLHKSRINQKIENNMWDY